ncbi:MAG: MFS transporter [Phycisphaerae bacterium]|nr:MFS transporter [Phycisphaerae bacterium]
MRSAAAAVEEPIQHPPGYRLRRGRNWFFLGLTYASYYLCRYNLSPIGPDMSRDLGLTKGDFGAITAGRDFAYAFGQMINGLITDRVGGKAAMTIGALGTIVLNLAFGLTSQFGASVVPLVWTLVFIRSADGWFQAYGAPGFIKINAAWFLRRERGAFAGIFGAMINLGAIGAGALAKAMATGWVLTLGFMTLAFPAMHWRYMFYLPPIAVAVIVLLMNLLVKNTPEEAGFRVPHDDDTGEMSERVRLRDVFRKVASNPTVWLIACAYFCTGFVRRSIETWWSFYLAETWKEDRATSTLFNWFVVGLPLTATLGSIASGYVSDLFFRGRRAPVAAVLYIAQVALCAAALMIPQGSGGPAAALNGVLLVLGISMMCNSTHSILGTASAMDVGGRKMAGCAAGIIDSFQYFGAPLAAYGLGMLFDRIARMKDPASTIGHLNTTLWFGSMLPFGLIGATLMSYLWLRDRGADKRGA